MIKQIATTVSTYSKLPDIVVLLDDDTLWVYVPNEGWQQLPSVPVPLGAGGGGKVDDATSKRK